MSLPWETGVAFIGEGMSNTTGKWHVGDTCKHHTGEAHYAIIAISQIKIHGSWISQTVITYAKGHVS